MNIHDIINARTSAGNAYRMGWDGTMNFCPHGDTRARYFQSAVHTYEALGLVKRATLIGPARFRRDFTTTAAFIREVIARKGGDPAANPDGSRVDPDRMTASERDDMITAAEYRGEGDR